jgi:hypothetical protein
LRWYENRVLRRIFGPKEEEVVGDWRRLHNEELHNFYLSQNIITVIRSRRMRWAGHVAWMGEMRNAYSILMENLKEKDYSEELGLDAKITLKYILEKECGKLWTGCIRLRIGSSGGLLCTR